MLPTLRLFFVLKSVRRVVFFLVPLLPYMAAVVGLMVCVLAMWSIVGVALFGPHMYWLGSRYRADQKRSEQEALDFKQA